MENEILKKDNEFNNKFLETIKSFINFSFQGISILCWLIVYSLLGIGATSSIILLGRLYPKDASILFSFAFGLSQILLKITYVLFTLLVGGLAAYLLIKFVTIPIIKDTKRINLERKEKFREELKKLIKEAIKEKKK